MFLTPKMRLHPSWLAQVSQTATTKQADIVGYNGQNQQFNDPQDLIASYLVGQTPMSVAGMLINKKLAHSIKFDSKLSMHAETFFLYSIFRNTKSAIFLGGSVRPQIVSKKVDFKAEHLQIVSVLESISECVQQNYPELMPHAWRYKHQTLTQLYRQIKQLSLSNRRIFKGELTKIKAELRTIEFKQLEFSNIGRLKSWLNRQFDRHMIIYPETENSVKLFESAGDLSKTNLG